VVTAGRHRVTVTGTKFNVRNLPRNAVEVAVTEGSVVVTLGEGEEARNVLRAGDVFLFPAAGAPLRRNLTAEEASAWRSGHLHFDDAGLGEVLMAVNRYAAKPIVAGAVDLTGLTLTARISADDTKSFLVILKELFQFEIEEHPDHWRLVARR
jgi:ferric-dicitrate binding protein FerR (iron transport regulator)